MTAYAHFSLLKPIRREYSTVERLKVFISGTQDDMQPERQAVADAVRALRHEPVMAETYGTLPHPPVNVVREMVERCDIYVGVYGARYGWKMDSGISVTEFEFNEFRRKHPDRILVYVKDITPEPEQAAFLTRVQDFKEGYFRRPKFQNAAQLATWVQKDLAQLIARAWHQIRGLPEPASVEAYLEEVAAQKPYVLWTDQTYIDRTVTRTDDLFARTVARYAPRTLELKEQAKPEPLEQALARERKVVLLGKTTSLVHLAWEAANRALAKPPAGSEPAGGSPEIPIYVELKYYSGETELETLLARRVNEILRTRNLMLAPDLAESTRILKAWLAQSDVHFLLLLDELNEVRPEFHIPVHGALQALLNSPHRIVISCRERDYDESLHDHASAFVLQGLQRDEIRRYLQRVLGAKGKKLFDEQMRRDKKMQTLAANPLMLWLISIVAQGDPESHLPANRGQLFQQFVAIIPRLRAREGIRAGIPPDMVITALAKLGFEMQEHGRVTVDLGEMRGWQILTAGRQLEEVLAQAKDWRFLKSDGRLGEPVEFLHQLFLEYFAAEYLRRKLKDQPDYPRILGKRLFTGTWDEVIIMLAGISDRSAEMVKWLAAQMVEKKQWHAALLIQGCWETSDAARDLEARAAVIDGLIAALGDPDAHVDWSVTRALVRIGVPAVERLIATLRDPHGYVRNRALDALVQIGPPAVEPLIDALRDPNPNMRKRAAGALGQIRDPRACASLIVALRDADVVVRRRAAYALWEISCAQGVEPLIAVLHDTDAIVRQRAAYALGQLRDPRAVKPLISNLRDADKDVRACTVDALGRIGDPRAVEALIAALHDSEPEVRWSAADALGRISDPRALAELERVAQEDKGHRKYRGRVADAARKAAEKIQRRKGNK